MADIETGEVLEVEADTPKNWKEMLASEIDNIIYTGVYLILLAVVFYFDNSEGKAGAIAMATTLGGALVMKIKAR